jgi:tetratricopeptide (TPR) repeat protein
MKHIAGLLFLVFALPAFADDPGWREAVAKMDELRLAGRYAEAEAAISKLWQEARKPGRGEQYRAAAYNNAGVVYQEMGRCQEGRNSYERALEIWMRLGAKEELWTHTATNLVALAVDCGEAKVALRLYELYLAKWDSGLPPGDPRHSRLLEIRGTMHLGLNKYLEAERFFLDALAIAEKNGNRESIAIITTSLSMLYSKRGEHERAIQNADRSLPLSEQYMLNYPLSGRLFANLAIVRQRAGDLEGARPLFEKALAVTRDRYGPNHELMADIELPYAKLLRKLKLKAEASEMIKAANAIRGENARGGHWDSTLNAPQVLGLRPR